MSNPATSGGPEEKEFFCNLVSLALADGRITHEEYDMLYIIGKKVGASQSEVDAIIRSARADVSIVTADPVTNQKRLINLIRMMWADGEMDDKELRLVTKFCEGLGFEKNRIRELVDKISQMVVEEMDESSILEAIK